MFNFKSKGNVILLTVLQHNEFFGPIERDFSSSIMTNTARQFDTYVARGVML